MIKIPKADYKYIVGIINAGIESALMRDVLSVSDKKAIKIARKYVSAMGYQPR